MVGGGTVAGYLIIRGNSMVTISSGSISNLTTTGTSTADVNGGSLNGLVTYNSSVLDLFGKNLTATFDYAGIDGGEPLTIYTLTGTLRNGDALNTLYYSFGGTLEFNGVPAQPVPEATTLVSAGLLLLLGLGGMVVSRRRKAGAVR